MSITITPEQFVNSFMLFAQSMVGIIPLNPANHIPCANDEEINFKIISNSLADGYNMLVSRGYPITLQRDMSYAEHATTYSTTTSSSSTTVAEGDIAKEDLDNMDSFEEEMLEQIVNDLDLYDMFEEQQEFEDNISLLDQELEEGHDIFGLETDLLDSNLRTPFDRMNDLSKAQHGLYKKFNKLKRKDEIAAWELYENEIYEIHKEWCRVYENEYVPALKSFKNYAKEKKFTFNLDKIIQLAWYPGDEKYLQVHEKLLPQIYQNYSGFVRHMEHFNNLVFGINY